jgi:UDP-N-acetylmuramoyl-tripeptide--D-alanyl-D-alanine ligase
MEGDIDMPAVWGRIRAEEILLPIQGTQVSGNGQTIFSGISTDSRTLKPGEFFCALPGDNYDGHDFLLGAMEKGAAGVLVQKRFHGTGALLESARKRGLEPVIIAVEDTLKALGDLASWWRHQHPVRVVAITGSAGKSTTKEMAAAVLEQNHRILKNPGNFNNLIGLPVSLLGLEAGQDIAVLEMGMNRPGEIARLTEIADPDVGVITNVGAAHIEGVGDLNGVARAKTELVERMRSGGQVILNGEDDLLMKTAALYRKDFLTFGFGRDHDVRATSVQSMGPEGLSFQLNYQNESLPVRLRVPMLRNVMNALAAAAVGFSLGQSAGQIAQGLYGFAGIKGRFTVLNLPGGITLVDDTYNANPSSLKAALESARLLAGRDGRMIVGLGEMLELGKEASKAHLDAGRQVAEAGAYALVAMGGRAGEMIRGAVAAGIPAFHAREVSTHGEMTEEIRGRILRRGDVILLKGSRRMHLERVVDGLKEALSI